MRIKLTYFYLLLFGFISLKSNGQDAQFSQFNSSFLYLNPAMAGANHGARLNLNYRNQWASYPGSLVHYVASADINVKKMKSGFGVLAMMDKGGSALFKKSTAALYYAYQIEMNAYWKLRFGAEVGLTTRDGDFDNYVFGNDLDNYGNNLGVGDPIGSDYARSNNLDLGFGMLMYSEHSWIGLTAKHLNRPDLNQGSNTTAVYNEPIYYSLHGGTNLMGSRVGDYQLIYQPAFQLRKQGGFSQLDVGANVQYASFIGGIWFRGIPLLSRFENFDYRDALSFMVGFELEGLRVGYSYDLTLSKLANVQNGSHELSIVYSWGKRENPHVRSVNEKESYPF